MKSPLVYLFLCGTLFAPTLFAQRSHPRLMANAAEIETAKVWIANYPWYRAIVEAHKKEIDRFIAHGPIYVSPIKQTYQYQMYTCPKHNVQLMYEEFRPFKHRCPKDTTEIYSGGKYDAAWAGWYNRLLATRLVWMGILYNVEGDMRYAEAGKSILMQFADLYLKYPTANTILGPAHVFFGTLSESFWGVDMAYGYDLLYSSGVFTPADRQKLKDDLFYPLAHITQLFPESASNRQLWYNNVSAAVGFLYGDSSLIHFALDGKYGFNWQLGSALPESGFWPEWSGYHFVALRGMIHLAEMARHNGLDLYHRTIAGRSMKKMFDAPFEIILPNYEFPRSKDSGGGNLLEYSTFYEVGYAVYRDPKYAALLNKTSSMRGQQVVGETSALGEADAPITMFQLVPDLPVDSTDFYPTQSVNLKGNGFAVLRNGAGKDRRYLYLDYGIMGGEHGHPDRMQIGYYANGRNWIVDPLNESYFDPMLQLWFRQTIAHNTVVVDQASQTWTNGEGRFFGALAGIQVASGMTTTAYPGVTDMRTIIQVGDYFIDLADVTAKEPRIIDWPLHSFGKLTLNGVSLLPEPRDLFGPEPGIPGYDQLIDIRSAKTDADWSGVFEDGKDHFAIFGIGEKGTKLFQSISPRIGGFYKQMVKDPKPMPMIMIRRITNSTRFASLMTAYENRSNVVGFSNAGSRDRFRVQRTDGEDLIYADVPNSKYWVLRTAGRHPVRLSGLNVNSVEWNGHRLLDADAMLGGFESRWAGDTLSVILPDQFSRIRIWSPTTRIVTAAGRDVPFSRDGEYVVLRSGAPAVEIMSPQDSTLYLGRTNTLAVNVWNPTSSPVRGSVSLHLRSDWREQVQSQLGWWGGIVNLKATNKGPVHRTVFPVHYDGSPSAWIGVKEGDATIAPSGKMTFRLNITVPNDAPPVVLPAELWFGKERIPVSLNIRPPVEAGLMLPNAKKNQLDIQLKNPRSVAEEVSLVLRDDTKSWHIRSYPKTVRLRPGESRTVAVPVAFNGYSSKEQLYPVHLTVRSGKFHSEIVHDFRVGLAHRAKGAGFP